MNFDKQILFTVWKVLNTLNKFKIWLDQLADQDKVRAHLLDGLDIFLNNFPFSEKIRLQLLNFV